MCVDAFGAEPATTLRCEVIDADSGDALPVRVYVSSPDGRWFFARSASPEGSAVVYDKQRMQGCIEKHTTVSAHPFLVDVPPGSVALTIERGKEYIPLTKTVEVGREPVQLRIELKRWMSTAKR
jgi:hypothetical protein